VGGKEEGGQEDVGEGERWCRVDPRRKEKKKGWWGVVSRLVFSLTVREAVFNLGHSEINNGTEKGEGTTEGSESQACELQSDRNAEYRERDRGGTGEVIRKAKAGVVGSRGLIFVLSIKGKRGKGGTGGGGWT